jgi:hypothetical protein
MGHAPYAVQHWFPYYSSTPISASGGSPRGAQICGHRCNPATRSMAGEKIHGTCATIMICRCGLPCLRTRAVTSTRRRAPARSVVTAGYTQSLRHGSRFTSGAIVKRRDAAKQKRPAVGAMAAIDRPTAKGDDACKRMLARVRVGARTGSERWAECTGVSSYTLRPEVCFLKFTVIPFSKALHKRGHFSLPRLAWTPEADFTVALDGRLVAR